MIAPVIINTSIKKYFPDDLKLEYSKHYKNLSIGAFIQVIFLFLMWMLLSLYTFRMT